MKSNIKESKRKCDQHNPTKFRVLPAQNMVYDCYFIDEYDIATIVNFMIALGKQTDFVDVDSVKTSLTEIFDRIILLV